MPQHTNKPCLPRTAVQAAIVAHKDEIADLLLMVLRGTDHIGVEAMNKHGELCDVCKVAAHFDVVAQLCGSIILSYLASVGNRDGSREEAIEMLPVYKRVTTVAIQAAFHSAEDLLEQRSTTDAVYLSTAPRFKEDQH